MSQALSLAELHAYDGEGTGRGAERRFLCPLCGDSKPRDTSHRSLCANVETGLWKCQRCGAHGKLKENHTARPGNAALREQAAMRARLMERAAAPPEPAAADWLQPCHGGVSLAKHPDCPGAVYLAGRGIDSSTLPQIARGCFYHPSFRTDPQFRGRPALLFPLRDRSTVTVAVQARYIDGGAFAHIAIGHKKAGAFYTRFEMLNAPVIVLTEAPIDALSLFACGVPAIATCGTEVAEWLPVACVLKSVILAFDSDEAGEAAATKLRPILESMGTRTARLKPDRVKDWNQALQSTGSASLTGWLRARLSHIAYFEFGLSTTHTDWWPFVDFTSP